MENLKESKEKTNSSSFLKPPYSYGVATAFLLVLAFIFPSMAWFLLVSFGLGFALTRQANLMTLGYGIAAFAVLSVALNLVGIPLHWTVFLLISIILLGYFYYKKEFVLDMSNFSLKDNKIILAVILFFAINTYFFWVGASSYPYLEDDDPWYHAEGAKWVAMSGSFSRSIENVDTHYKLYIEPYPPTYDVLMGVLHQLNSSLSETLKFYNAFLVGLGLIFAFYCFSELTKDARLALLATFFLLILPSFMSHFIWAQTLALIMMFVAFHGYEKSLQDKRWIIPAAVAAAAVAVAQPSTAVNFVLFSILYFIAKLLVDGKSAARPLITVAVAGALLASIYYVPVFIKFGFTEALEGFGFNLAHFDPTSGLDTSSGAIYSVSDFIFAPTSSKIDQATGIGPIISLLALGGAILAAIAFRKEKNSWLLISLLWLILTIIGTEGNAMPIKLFPHRFWAFLSIPVALLAAYAYTVAEKRTESTKRIFLLFILAMAVYTSAIPKMSVQTVQWPPGVAFSSSEEILGYVTMQESLPVNTRVFPVCSNDAKVIGFDMLSEPYVPEYLAFKQEIDKKSAQEAYQFLKSRGYLYVTFDSSCVASFGQEKTSQIANDYLGSGLFVQEFSNQGFLLLKLK